LTAFPYFGIPEQATGALHNIALLLLVASTLGDVMEDQNDSQEIALRIANGRAAIVNRSLGSISAYQGRVVRQPYDDPFAQHLLDRIFHRLAGLFVDDDEDFLQPFAEGFCWLPAS